MKSQFKYVGQVHVAKTDWNTCFQVEVFIQFYGVMMTVYNI
jgi:hypothetical protein